ncbi:MAG: sensor histidine kinase [Vulcanimicrobiaceae bacterium]
MAESEDVLHALDLAMAGDWARSRAAIQDAQGPIAGRLAILLRDIECKEAAYERKMKEFRHEIGNALSIAQANVEALIDGALEPTPARYAGIYEALRDADYLVDDLRRRPRDAASSTVVIDTFDICALIKGQCAAIQGLAEAKAVRILYDPCGQPHRECSQFRGDATRVDQVLRNVLINAVRYTPPGGLVDISCRHKDAELSISVRDSGPGIASNDLPHIFEEGFRSNSAPEAGSGLGLNVVETLLDALGGHARVANRDGAGVTFIVSLPAAPLPV